MQIVTPKGKLFWVTITGAGQWDFNKTFREFKASLVLPKDSDEAKELVSTIDEFYASEYPKGKAFSKGYKLTGEDTKEGDTHYTFSFKTRAEYPSGAPKVIGIFNARGEKADLGETLVGNGSIGKISAVLQTWSSGAKSGVSLYLEAVQIIHLEEYLKATGFEADEEGTFEGTENIFLDERV